MYSSRQVSKRGRLTCFQSTSTSENDQVYAKTRNCLDCKGESLKSSSKDDTSGGECDKNWKQKAFVEALTRIAVPDESCQMMKTYKKQLRKNEDLRDQVTRQEAVHMGVLLEGKLMQGTLEMQSKTLCALQEKLRSKEDRVDQQKQDLGAVVASIKCKEDEMQAEMKKLDCEKEKSRNEVNSNSASFMNDSINNEALDKELTEWLQVLCTLRSSNEQQRLGIQFLKNKKCYQSSQIKELDERDQFLQKQIDQLSDEISKLNLLIETNTQTIKHQKTQQSQLTQNVCDSKSKVEALVNDGVAVEEQTVDAKERRSCKQQQLEEAQQEQQGLQISSQTLRCQVQRLRRGLQKDRLTNQDAFCLKC